MSYVNRPIDDTPDPAIVTKATDLVRWGPIIRSCSSLSDSTDFERPRRRYWDRLPFRFRCTQIKRRWSWHRCRNLVNYQLVYFLIVGGWITTRACGPMNRGTALLNGTILATTLALALGYANGVSGAFGVAACWKSSTRFNSKVASRFRTTHQT